MRKIIGSCVAAALLISAGVASAQSVAFSNEFGVGAQGSNVTNLQTWLTDKGYYSGPITGYYGSLTQAGVEAFQSANGISATGFVGPLTLSALNSMDTGVSTTGTVSTNSTELAQLQSELDSLLAQIQAIESGTTSTVPTGSNITLQTNEGVGASGAVTASGTGPFTYAIVNQPSNGVVNSFNTQTGAFTYTPNANFSGNDTFTYTVANSSGTSAPMTVTIAVSPTSNTTTTPVGQPISFSTSGGAAFNGTLTASGTGPFTYTIVTGPLWGSISNFNSSTGAFTYTPTSATYTGSDSFTYTVSNGTSTSVPSMVSITD
jgi:peptidoglycan hydrolase-like protein with peptidoglycan-binding domain